MTVNKLTYPAKENAVQEKINEIIDNLGGGGSGSGRNVGELVYSAMPLTDAGLHLLDGTLLSGGGIYEEFVQYVAGLVSDYPDLFATEASWQAAVSANGVCGKFVYTAGATWYKWYSSQWNVYFYVQSLNPQYGDPIFYYDGSTFTQSFYVGTVTEGSPDDTMTSTDGTATLTRAHGDTTIDIEIQSSVRLPKITGIIEGTTSVSALGDLVAAGLPNIEGTIENIRLGATLTGSFYPTSGTSGTGTGSSATTSYNWNFDASRSSSIYGNSTTVQPQTIKQLVYMVIANSTKTEIEVDIDQIATDLNGKADVDLTNLSNGLANTICTTPATTTSTASSATPAVIVENYKNGTSWYRIYSDGWCEQGGAITLTQGASNVLYTFSLLKPFVDTNYYVSRVPVSTGTTDMGTSHCLFINEKGTNQFKAYCGFSTIVPAALWMACGYIS